MSRGRSILARSSTWAWLTSTRSGRATPIRTRCVASTCAPRRRDPSMSRGPIRSRFVSSRISSAAGSSGSRASWAPKEVRLCSVGWSDAHRSWVRRRSVSNNSSSGPRAGWSKAGGVSGSRQTSREPMAASKDLRDILVRGLVIPAHPLALTADRRFDERRQVALTRYYCDAGAGGIAVGVHTTQFAIRDPGVQLLKPVLELAIRTARDWSVDRRVVTIAGVCGRTGQGVAGAKLESSFDYDVALLSLAALRHEDNRRVLDHCRRVSDVLPVMGFYLQPAVGGRVLDRAFWREFL